MIVRYNYRQITHLVVQSNKKGYLKILRVQVSLNYFLSWNIRIITSGNEVTSDLLGCRLIWHDKDNLLRIMKYNKSAQHYITQSNVAVLSVVKPSKS